MDSQERAPQRPSPCCSYGASNARCWQTFGVPPDDRDLAHTPDAPCHAYLLLRNLEIVLRELIIMELSSLGDAKWWKRRAPHDVQETAKRGQQYERATRWLDASTYHPIYYTDFADVRKILISRDNWQARFNHVLYNKENLSADLQSLEPLRNTIAHSRRLSEPAVGVLIAVSDKIQSSLGKQKWDTLSEEQTVVHADIEVPRVLSVLTTANRDLDACRRVDLAIAVGASGQWWWDSDVLGGSLEQTERALSLLSEYNSLPRGRGQGHILEAWARKTRIIASIEAAIAELQTILTARR